LRLIKYKLNTVNNAFPTKARIFNYSFSFSTKKQTEWARQRHQDAVNRYFKKELSGGAIERHIKDSLGYFKNKQQKTTEHPLIMQDKIKNLKPSQKGYNMWGLIK